MRKNQWFAIVCRGAVLSSTLAIVVGCGEEAAGLDPESRAQTQADAKSAMESTSKKKSEGVSQQQNTKNAMQAGSRQQRARTPN